MLHMHMRCVYNICIYIYIYLVCLGNYQDVFLWFPSSTSPNVFVWFPSLVFLWFPSSQETFFYGFRRWFFNGFRRGRKRFLMASVAERFLMVSTFFNGFRR